MTRLELFQSAVSQYDTIYTGLILAAAWVAGMGHILDAATSQRGRALVTTFWVLVILSYVGGMITLAVLL